MKKPILFLAFIAFILPLQLRADDGADYKKLKLTSMCWDSSWGTFEMRVRNTNNYDVSFKWDIYGTDISGEGVAAPGDTYFNVPQTTSASVTVRLFANNVQEDVKATNSTACLAVTPDDEPTCGGIYPVAANEWRWGNRYDGKLISESRRNAANAIGEPNSDFFSLGFSDSSYVVLRFANPVTGKLTVYETSFKNNNYPLEKAAVYVSCCKDMWFYLGDATNQVDKSASDHHPTTFDLEGMCVRYVMIVDRTDKNLFKNYPDADGFDVAGVCAQKESEYCNDEADITPFLESDENYMAVFGYTSNCKFPVVIPVGEKNKFECPGVEDYNENQGQPTWFFPGTHNDVLRVAMTGHLQNWNLAASLAGTNESPLPVELTSFEAAAASNGGTSLQWSTATEVNNYGFDVERKSADDPSASFIKVAFVPGSGNSNAPKTYSYADNSSLAPGNYVYRLKQIDFDGKYEYSDNVEVTLTQQKQLVMEQNYPNPFNPTTNIKFSLPEASHVKLTVYNILGETISVLVDQTIEAGSHTVSFNASSLHSGIYIYKLEAGNFSQINKMNLVK